MGWFIKYVFKSVWLGARVGAVGGTAYFLHSEGVFSHTADAGQTWEHIKAQVPKEITEPIAQVAGEYLPTSALPALPSVDFSPREAWNCGVLATFDRAAKIPQYARCGYAMAYNAISDLTSE